MKNIVLILIAITCFGCSTISSRISEHQMSFNSYPPEVQAQIQSGRIDRGFTEEMVYMAKGKPSDKSTITKSGKKLVIWKYARNSPVGSGSQYSSSLSSPYGYPSFGPGPTQPAPVFYEKSYFIVEFENEKVVGWDQDLQNDSDIK